MYCPDCGTNAGEAKFCPECGADLVAYREARAAGAGAGKAADGGGASDTRPSDAGVSGAKAGKSAGAKGANAAAGSLGPQARTEPASGPSARLIWILVAVVAAVVVGVVLFTQYGMDGESDGGTAGNGGSYEELVAQANALFDEGDALFNQNEIDQGAQKFASAAQLYEQAWTMQPGDPNVGTDWATSLFYSGDIQGAIKRIELVLKDDPEFQTAWFNKGNYLTHEARISEQMGTAGDAKKLYEKARQAYVKAIALDPKSEVGKEADSRLQDLPD